LSQLIAGL
jgi:hypothetical protein